MIRDLQIFIQRYQQQGVLIFLLMDGNQDDLHVFQQKDITTKVCNPLGFNYDKNIDGSIATLVESCNLVNIHKLKHGDVPATHTGSFQIDLGSSSMPLPTLSTDMVSSNVMLFSQATTELYFSTLTFSVSLAIQFKAHGSHSNAILSYMIPNWLRYINHRCSNSLSNTMLPLALTLSSL
jgi:hypothetical protein